MAKKIVNKPVKKAVPAKKTPGKVKPTVKAKPSPKPAAKAKPVVKQKAVVKPKPAVKPKAVVNAKPTVKSKPVLVPSKSKVAEKQPAKAEAPKKKAEAPDVKVAEKSSGKLKSESKVSHLSLVEPPADARRLSKAEKAGMSPDAILWHEYYEKCFADVALEYKISGVFEAKTPLQHKLFGWGFILTNEFDRLEVLFKDGRRMLISNRKLS